MLKFQKVLCRNKLQVNWHIFENIRVRTLLLAALYTDNFHFCILRNTLCLISSRVWLHILPAPFHQSPSPRQTIMLLVCLGQYRNSLLAQFWLNTANYSGNFRSIEDNDMSSWRDCNERISLNFTLDLHVQIDTKVHSCYYNRNE